jgi:hypothetical protein
MTYPGYSYELKTKNYLKKKGLALKLSRGNYADLLWIDFSTGIVYLIECKTHKKRWYANLREKKQFKRLQDLKIKIGEAFLQGNNRIKIRYYIREKGEEKVLNLEEVKREYFKNG